jgi:prepilin signal peptidase PulO-like enzyme (type II secretory pathway)
MLFGALLKILFLLFSAAIAAADIKTGAVPRMAFICAFPVFLALRSASDNWNFPWLSILGAIVGLSVFLLAFVLSKKKLGLADVWYSGLMGLVLGLWRWYMAVSIACVLAVLYILFRKKASGSWAAAPFIPFMAAGGIAIGLAGGKIQ